MKTLISLLVAILIMVPFNQPRAAVDSEEFGPLVAIMAQHFVYQHLLKKNQAFSSVIFDVAAIHPQPERNYWAVIGGYLTNRQNHSTFVAAVRLVCSDPEKPDCWFLQKLAINHEIVLDISDPL